VAPRDTDTLPEELRLMVEAGTTPAQAHSFGTVAAAELLGLDYEPGALEPGKKAYPVVVVGDPLEDIEALREVRLVLLDGVEAAQKNLPVHYFLGSRNETNRPLTK
jgi:imidazolonepropionase-like amidohydrolase